MDARHPSSPSGTPPRAPDLGRWFSTAGGEPQLRSRRSPWGPDPRGGYGTVSPPETVRAALEMLRGRTVTALTGAGVSTGSGLPDYRGPDTVPRTPMTFQEFVRSDLSRRRYWARSTVGWVSFSRARPGPAHRLIADLAPALGLGSVITQNVDGLHQAAGSRTVIDLHGRLDTVRCLSCRTTSSREALHARLLAMNPDIRERLDELAADAVQAPDGDAEVDRTARFRYPPCPLCGGILKPDVVFFGESADPELVAQAFAAVRGADALLVLGSSLSVRSGLRFVVDAAHAGTPVVVVNDGPTRADDLATVRVHGRIEDVLAAWAGDLGIAPEPRHASRCTMGPWTPST